MDRGARATTTSYLIALASANGSHGYSDTDLPDFDDDRISSVSQTARLPIRAILRRPSNHDFRWPA